MERKTYTLGYITRYTVVFTLDEVKQILHKAAQDAGKGLPVMPDYIQWPRDPTDAKIVIIGAEIERKLDDEQNKLA